MQKDEGVEAARDAILTGTGKKIMDEIKAFVLRMNEDEELLMHLRSERVTSMVRRDLIFKLTGVILIFLTTIFVISGVNRWLAEYKNKEKKHIALATTDGLTGLINRRHFFDILEREVLQVRIKGHSLAVVLFDIDHFKSINDTYGHLNGDVILKQMSQIIKENVYPLDVVARYGGDEFIILMPGTSSYEAFQAIEKIRKIIDQFQWEVDDKQISVTTSVGLTAIDGGDINDAYDLVNKADIALYSAKRQGRNCVVCSDESNSALKQEEPDNRVYRELQTKVASLTSKISLQALGMISAFTRAMEMRNEDNPYTIRHSENVRIYANAIAEEMQLSAELKQRICIAAMLKDIGEIIIPDNILKKTTTLTKEDWKIIKQHPVAAAKILEPLELFNLELQMIKHHHERFDGTGYPLGLKGKEIPIGARILAVADAFDAITSKHGYKQCRTYNSALKEISCCCGTQFDPDVVKAFCKAIEKYKLEIEKKQLTIR